MQTGMGLVLQRAQVDDSALEVLRAQEPEGVGLDGPPRTLIFTDSLSAKAVAEKAWISDRMTRRHIRYSMFLIKSYRDIASGDIKLAYIKGADLCPNIMTKKNGSTEMSVTATLTTLAT